MDYEYNQSAKSSFNTWEMTQCFPVTNAPINWKHAIWSNGDNSGNLPTLCKDLRLPNKGVMSSASLVSNFPEPGSLYDRSTFCTSLHVSPSSTLDPHTQILHPRAEYLMPQSQTSSPLLLQGEDIAYQQYEDQISGHSELLGDIVAGNFDWAVGIGNTAEQKDWQVQSKQFDLIMNNDQNPGIDETYKETEHSPINTNNIDHNQRNISFSSSLEEEINSSISGSDSLNKPRMRWSQKLHNCFVRAVNDLGGADRATPKFIAEKMGIEGVTIYQVKSHLQKYRLARYQPDVKEDKRSSASEVKKRSTIDKESEPLKKTMHDSETLLRMQWELQKSLHDQLEFQRELQLRAEENAQQLQKLLEKQKRVGQAFMLANQSLASTSSTTAGNPPSTPSDLAELIVITDELSKYNSKLPDNNEDRLDLRVKSPSPKKAKLDLLSTSTS